LWQLAQRFWRIARDTRRIEVNIIGATAAICLDLGFTPAQVAPMAVMLLTPGTPPRRPRKHRRC
jgi:hypothetical protein